MNIVYLITRTNDIKSNKLYMYIFTITLIFAGTFLYLFPNSLAVNLSQGKYSFFSIADPTKVNGEMNILARQ